MSDDLDDDDCSDVRSSFAQDAVQMAPGAAHCKRLPPNRKADDRTCD
jgi:hypothetical protein